jgi:hypothetical protein
MRRNQERKNLNANKKESINHEELNFRFKSSLKLNMKDGLDNEQLVGSSEITETRKVYEKIKINLLFFISILTYFIKKFFSRRSRNRNKTNISQCRIRICNGISFLELYEFWSRQCNWRSK